MSCCVTGHFLLHNRTFCVVFTYLLRQDFWYSLYIKSIFVGKNRGPCIPDVLYLECYLTNRSTFDQTWNMCSAKAAQSEITELFSKFAHSCNFFVPVLAVQWRSGRTDGRGRENLLKTKGTTYREEGNLWFRGPPSAKKIVARSDFGQKNLHAPIFLDRQWSVKTCHLWLSMTDHGESRAANKSSWLTPVCHR